VNLYKYLHNRPTYFFFIALLSVGFAAFYPFNAESLARADSRDLDQLFGDMGVSKISQALPVEITLMDLNGRPVNLSDFRGKIVFLNFWTTWCFDCRIEMPHMEKLHQKFKNKEFEMVAVNLQEPASQVNHFFKDYKLTFTALLDSDGEVGAHFRVTAIPTTYILDKQGIIIGKVMGPRKWDGKKAFALFEHLTISGLTTSDHVQRQGAS
jgi:thiol-disulfide isomerase/thioredoxin